MRLTLLSSKTQGYQGCTEESVCDKVTMSHSVSEVGLAVTEKPGNSLFGSFDKALLLLLFTSVVIMKGDFWKNFLREEVRLTNWYFPHWGRYSTTRLWKHLIVTWIHFPESSHQKYTIPHKKFRKNTTKVRHAISLKALLFLPNHFNSVKGNKS